MSVVKTVGRGVMWTTASTIFGKIIIFVNVFLVLHFLSVYEYGFTELVMSIISTVGIFLLPGLTNTIVADMAVERARGDKQKMNRIFHQYLYLNLALGVVAWAALFFGSHPLASLAGNEYVAQFLKIASFLFIISPLRTMTQILATVMLRFFDQSFYGVIEEVVKCVLLLGLVVWLDKGIFGLMYAIVFSQIIVVILYLPRSLSAYRYFSSEPAHDSTHFWNLVRAHRKWSVGSSYIGTISQNARIWLIKMFLGTEAVGLFAFSYGILSHLTSLMPLGAVIAPIVPRYVDKRDQLIRILRASIKIQLVLAIVIVAGTFAFGTLFVSLLFPKYIAAVPMVFILALSLISNSIVQLFVPVFAAFKEQRSMLFSNVFKLVSGVIILPISILFFGALGPAVELVCTTLLNSFERYARLRRVLPGFSVPLKDMFRPDPYEIDAMRTVGREFLARLPRIGPLRYIKDL